MKGAAGTTKKPIVIHGPEFSLRLHKEWLGQDRLWWQQKTLPCAVLPQSQCVKFLFRRSVSVCVCSMIYFHVPVCVCLCGLLYLYACTSVRKLYEYAFKYIKYTRMYLSLFAVYSLIYRIYLSNYLSLYILQHDCANQRFSSNQYICSLLFVPCISFSSRSVFLACRKIA